MSEQKLMVVLGADTSSFTRAMITVQAQMKAAAETIEDSIQEAEQKVDRETKKMADHLDRVKRGFMGFNRIGAIGGLITSGLSTAAPLLATVAGGAGALGSAFAAAGVGVAGFAAVAVSNLGAVFTATDETFSQLSAAQQKAYKDLQGFKSFWKGFAKEFEQPTMDIFSKGLKVTQDVLTAIKPAIQGTAEAVNRLMDSLSASLKTDDMMIFFDYLNETAGGMVERFGLTFGNVFRGIANLLVGFAPLANDFMDGMVNMSKKFAEWSSAFRDSTGLQTFLDYVRTNAPVVLGILGNALKTVTNLLIVLAPLGQTVIG
ncbi:hypothetical protein LRS37_12795, partial [Neobacillus sedimentimangrovi]